MTKIKAYIISSAVISPQKTWDNTDFPDTFISEEGKLKCIEPEYRNIINPIQLRRMPRIIKMALASAQLCISRGGDANPDAIIVGTGLGCLDNLEKFLISVLKENEKPTSLLPFIHSTHNAVAAQIAMFLNNKSYNLTYCHRSLSFESVLIDSLLLLQEGDAKNVLAGGIDECTDNYIHLHSYLNYWKSPVNNLKLYYHKTRGTIPGEGSAFYLISDKALSHYDSMLQGVHTYLTPDGHFTDNELQEEIIRFLNESESSPDEIDLVILGINGDLEFDMSYNMLMDNFFSKHTAYSYYKHLCGEYYTSSSFALYLGDYAIRNQTVPEITLISGKLPVNIKKVLIYNHFRNQEHAFILLSSPA